MPPSPASTTKGTVAYAAKSNTAAFTVGDMTFYGAGGSNARRIPGNTIYISLLTYDSGPEAVVQVQGFDAPLLAGWTGIKKIILPTADRNGPPVSKDFWPFLKETLDNEAKDGPLNVLVYCQGGRGRTGTVLAILAGLYGAEDPMEFIRKEYDEDAVESKEQVNYVNYVLGTNYKTVPSDDFYPVGGGTYAYSYTYPPSADAKTKPLHTRKERADDYLDDLWEKGGDDGWDTYLEEHSYYVDCNYECEECPGREQCQVYTEVFSKDSTTK